MHPSLRSPACCATRLLLWQAVILLACVSLGGCRKERPDIRVAVLVDSLANPMRAYQVKLLEKLIHARAGVEVRVLDAAGDAARQAGHARDVMQDGAGFLMVFPQDAEKLAPVLREALGKGARVFVFSPDVPADACTSAIFTDDRRLGQIAGDFIIAALKSKVQAEGRLQPTGRVVLLRGDEDSPVCKRRAEGFLQSLAKAPGVILVHDAPANWSETDAAARTQEALHLQMQFDVICAQNDAMALGAAKAVREFSPDARKSMLIIGSGGIPTGDAGVGNVSRGELDASVYHPPLVDLAWQDMQAVLDHPDHMPPARRSVKPFIVTREVAIRLQQTGLPAPEVE